MLLFMMLVYFDVQGLGFGSILQKTPGFFTINTTANNLKIFDDGWDPEINHNTRNIPEPMYDLRKLGGYDSVRYIRASQSKIESYGKTITFNLNSTTVWQNENISKSELYLYKSGTSFRGLSRTSYIIRIYIVTNYFNKSPDSQDLMGVTYLSSSFQGWHTFNIQPFLLEKLRKLPKTHVNILLTVTDILETSINVDTFGFRETTNFSFLALKFSKSLNDFSKPVTGFEKQNYNNYDSSLCRRLKFRINFKNYPFNSFILYPTGLDLYYCAGECSLEISGYSNHAKFLNLIGGIQNYRTCCVPDNYQSVVIMYIDKFYNIVVKEYKDMIVAGCGCR